MKLEDGISITIKRTELIEKLKEKYSEQRKRLIEMSSNSIPKVFYSIKSVEENKESHQRSIESNEKNLEELKNGVLPIWHKLVGLEEFVALLEMSTDETIKLNGKFPYLDYIL